MKNYYNLRQKIIFYVMSVAVLVTVLVTAIMSAGSIRSNNALVLDNIRIMARTAAQNISSNLHLLTERMYNFSTEAVFTDDTAIRTMQGIPMEIRQAALPDRSASMPSASGWSLSGCQPMTRTDKSSTGMRPLPARSPARPVIPVWCRREIL